MPGAAAARVLAGLAVTRDRRDYGLAAVENGIDGRPQCRVSSG